jgi:predicted PurR-regulated permease PerM
MHHNYNLKKTSYILMTGSILFLFYFHLMGALLGGLAVFVVVNQLHDFIGTKVHSKWAHKVTMLAVTILTVLILGGIGAALYSGVTAANSTNAAITADFLQQIRSFVPAGLVNYIPEDLLILKDHALEFLKSHFSNVFSFTTHSMHALFIVLFGMLIGAIVAFSFLKDVETPKIVESAENTDNVEEAVQTVGPLTKELMDRIGLFTSVFQKVAFAQVKISAINTVLTGIYLLVILPFVGVHIPYVKTLVLLTFVFGLLPSIGNILSNILIVVLGLMVSVEVAVVSLLFALGIHKLEYFINAKIVGSELKISIWEMLIVILVFLTVFGVIGSIFSPVIYGYLKEELKRNKLI